MRCGMQPQAWAVGLEKATLRKCFDFCEGPYDFLLVENIPVEHRGRVRLNGWRGVKGLL